MKRLQKKSSLTKTGKKGTKKNKKKNGAEDDDSEEEVIPDIRSKGRNVISDNKNVTISSEHQGQVVDVSGKAVKYCSDTYIIGGNWTVRIAQVAHKNNGGGLMECIIIKREGVFNPLTKKMNADWTSTLPCWIFSPLVSGLTSLLLNSKMDFPSEALDKIVNHLREKNFNFANVQSLPSIEK